MTTIVSILSIANFFLLIYLIFKLNRLGGSGAEFISLDELIDKIEGLENGVPKINWHIYFVSEPFKGFDTDHEKLGVATTPDEVYEMFEDELVKRILEYTKPFKEAIVEETIYMDFGNEKLFGMVVIEYI